MSDKVENRKVLNAHVTFKSGYTVTFRVYTLNTTRDGEGDLTKLEWEMVNPNEQLLYINIKDIDMIVCEPWTP